MRRQQQHAQGHDAMARHRQRVLDRFLQADVTDQPLGGFRIAGGAGDGHTLWSLSVVSVVHIRMCRLHAPNQND